MVRSAAIQNPNATSDHLKIGLNDPAVHNRIAADLAIKHRESSYYKTLHESFENDIYSDSWNTKRDLFDNAQSRTPEEINMGLDDQDESIRAMAARHPNASEQNITKALNDPDDIVRQKAILSWSPNITSEHLSKALDDPSWLVRRAAVQHPRATIEHIAKGLSDPDGDVRLKAVEHKLVTKAQLKAAVEDDDRHVSFIAFQQLKSRFPT